MKEKEMTVWKDVLPSMMSEEETDDESFQRQRHSWKSRKLVCFLHKLDSRIKKNNKSSVPARERSYGPLLEVPTPKSVRSWMTCATDSPDESLQSGQSGDELFCDSEP